MTNLHNKCQGKKNKKILVQREDNLHSLANFIAYTHTKLLKSVQKHVYATSAWLQHNKLNATKNLNAGNREGRHDAKKRSTFFSRAKLTVQQHQYKHLN